MSIEISGSRSKGLTASELGADPIDIHIGNRLRIRRTLVGMSQEELGHAIGVTFQQIQKYERGVNRVSGSRLFDVACALRVPVAFFFEGVDENLVQARIERARKAHGSRPFDYVPPAQTSPVVVDADPLQRTENIALIRDVEKLSPDRQAALRDLVRAMTMSSA